MEERLKRLGIARESARLARKAAESERFLGIHGVSVTAGRALGPASQVDRRDLDREFLVHETPTRADPLHRTIELPMPVDQAVANRFNSLFGRGEIS